MVTSPPKQPSADRGCRTLRPVNLEWGVAAVEAPPRTEGLRFRECGTNLWTYAPYLRWYEVNRSGGRKRRYEFQLRTWEKPVYIAYLHKESASDFGVSFPDFPGCVTAGKTLEEARRRAVEALDLHVRGLLKDGEDVPAPSTLEQLAGDPGMRGAVALVVSLPATPSTLEHVP